MAPRLRWRRWDRRLRKSRETAGGAAALVVVPRMRSCIAITLKRFLYLSMSFSKVGSRFLEATYSAEVVFRRRKTVVGGLWFSFWRRWVSMVQEVKPNCNFYFS